jgi:hypothetical protein
VFATGTIVTALMDSARDAAGARHADEPEAPRRPYPDCAEPLTAWRVDLAVLVGVAQDAH